MMTSSSRSPSCREEAEFLESRQQRVSSRSSEERLNKIRLVNDFWSAVRSQLTSWKQRLDRFESETGELLCATDRKQARLILDELEADLEQIRKECLSKLDALELSTTDVRLLHDEFTKHVQILDSARERSNPRSKFVFKRYRAALKEYQQKQIHPLSTNPEPSTLPVEKDNSRDDEIDLTFDGSLIRDQSNSKIVVERNGLVHIDGEEISESKSKPSDPECRKLSHNLDALMLHRLDGCTIIINGVFTSVHLQNVKNCSLNMKDRVMGACHLTSCENIDLTATSQQLRVHKSSNLKCKVCVTSSPILEDSSGIEFFYDPYDQENAVSDTKDFDWLRNGIPSPHFALIVQKKLTQPVPKSGGLKLSDTNDPEISPPALDSEQQKKITNIEPLSSDSEDEL